MNANLYAELRTYAAQKGAIVGGMWILSFACFIIGLSHPRASLLCIMAGIGSIFVTGKLIRRFRQQKGEIGFFMAMWTGILMFMYASLLMAAAQFIYFRYMDNGFVADTYATLLQQPEVLKALQNMSGGENYRELIDQAIITWQTISPIELTFEFLVSNFFLGIIVSIPVAALGCIGKVSDTNSLKQ